ncbi:MAG: ribonuclease T [Edaphobacter sp.]
MRFSLLRYGVTVWLVVLPLILPVFAHAQQKGEPGKFDFYLLNLSWSPEFCSIQGTSPQCVAPAGFVVHGLWAQNNDGSYPVFCSERRGPVHPGRNLDLTPDRSLLEHEWRKHGTCTTLAPEDFFALERRAFHSLRVPRLFHGLEHEVEMKSAEISGLFAKANPSFPVGSILVSCSEKRLTAVEACFAKDSLKPIACKGLRGCELETIRVAPSAKK